MHFAIPFFVAAVDRIYWAIFGRILKVLPDRHGGGPWGAVLLQSVICGAAGVGGAIAIARLTGQSDLLTTLVGAFIAGRVVGVVIDIATTPSQAA